MNRRFTPPITGRLVVIGKAENGRQKKSVSPGGHNILLGAFCCEPSGGTEYYVGKHGPPLPIDIIVLQRLRYVRPELQHRTGEGGIHPVISLLY